MEIEDLVPAEEKGVAVAAVLLVQEVVEAVRVVQVANDPDDLIPTHNHKDPISD